MNAKTSKDLITSLHGSAFRRLTCDGRSWYVREIRTFRALQRRGRQPVVPPRALERIRTGRP